MIRFIINSLKLLGRAIRHSAKEFVSTIFIEKNSKTTVEDELREIKVRLRALKWELGKLEKEQKLIKENRAANTYNIDQNTQAIMILDQSIVDIADVIYASAPRPEDTIIGGNIFTMFMSGSTKEYIN